MADHGTGWERERRTHFDEIVLLYDRARPDYPAALFEDILAFCKPNKGKRALEIGAGTGKATRPFLGAGYDVTAVEIGANMAEFLRDKYREYKGFDVLQSSFEEAPLSGDSYDLIYAVSAFHWVDTDIGCPKVHQLLKEGGVFALLRFNILASDGEALYEDVQAAYEKHFRAYYPARLRPSDTKQEDFLTPSRIRANFGFEDMGSHGFQDVTMKFYEVNKAYTAPEYIAFLDTMADHRGLPASNREALYADITQAIDKHGGQYIIKYLFQLYMGRKSS